jgi:hypothetical protein
MILLEQKLANHTFPETQIQNLYIQLQGKLLLFSLVFPVRTRFSVHIQTGPKAHPVSSMMETVSLSQEKSSQSINVTIHYILEPIFCVTRIINLPLFCIFMAYFHQKLWKHLYMHSLLIHVPTSAHKVHIEKFKLQPVNAEI